MAMSDIGAPVLERRGTALRDPKFRRATVHRITYLTGRVKRLTIAGPALCDLPVPPPAAKVRLFLPQDVARAPDFPTWTPHGLLWPPGSRTAMRSYTVRRYDPDSGELDVDVILHGGGPGAKWAALARSGTQVGLLRPEGGYLARPETARHLLVGDETGLPAIAAILAALGPATCTAIVETGDPGLRRYPGAGPVRWLDRAGRAPGSALLRYVPELPVPPGPRQAFVAAEATPTRLLREHLRSRWGLSVPDGTMQAKGYWQAAAAERPAA